VYVKATVANGYHGPGTYSIETTPPLEGTLAYGVGFGTGQNGAYTIFRSNIQRTHTATTLTVQPDGSGSLVISNWESVEVRGETGPRKGCARDSTQSADKSCWARSPRVASDACVA
jgi:hypothetical protein